MVWLLGILVSASFALASCPPGFTERAGLCEYLSPYREGNPSHGLLKRVERWPEPLRPAAIELGRLLFFDPILSGDRTLSCAHCHRPDRGLADGLPQSRGKGGVLLPRGAPSLWNAALAPTLFLDARAHSLEEQLDGPLFSKEEMNITLAVLEQRLNSIPTYRRLFSEVFPETKVRGIKLSHVKSAIATFEKTLLSLRSRYDSYVFGDTSALDDREVQGLTVFRSFVTRCAECHEPPLFSNFEMARVGAPGDQGNFRTPSLRNVGVTAPYTHQGGFALLSDVIAFYDRGGGRSIPEYDSPYLHWHIGRIGMSRGERRALEAFLLTLTDESGRPEVPASVPSGLPVLERIEP